jgi:hypothetical protein
MPPGKALGLHWHIASLPSHRSRSLAHTGALPAMAAAVGEVGDLNASERRLALWEAPAAWLQRLTDDKRSSTGPLDIAPLMAASSELCGAVLRVLDQRRFVLLVRTHERNHVAFITGNVAHSLVDHTFTPPHPRV